MKKIKCFVGWHKWESEQTMFTSDTGLCVVIAWKVCKHCSESKLIHILS
jgi:hypothetical protein